MVRATLRDAEQMVSFLISEDTMRRIVAGCSAGPATAGELLVATDTYQRGIAARVMTELMEFDKTLHREGADSIRDEINLARDKGEPFEQAFQVFEEVTEKEALSPRGCEVILIDLEGKSISASANLSIDTSGEVRIHDGKAPTDRSVTYVLPKEWVVETT